MFVATHLTATARPRTRPISVLEQRSLALGVLAQERLVLRKAEDDRRAANLDRTARLDERLVGRVATDPRDDARATRRAGRWRASSDSARLEPQEPIRAPAAIRPAELPRAGVARRPEAVGSTGGSGSIGTAFAGRGAGAVRCAAGSALRVGWRSVEWLGRVGRCARMGLAVDGSRSASSSCSR